MGKLVSIENVRKASARSFYRNCAVRIASITNAFNHPSDIRFTPYSVIREYERLTRLGYVVALIDVGSNWKYPTIEELMTR